jgi:GTPase
MNADEVTDVSSTQPEEGAQQVEIKIATRRSKSQGHNEQAEVRVALIGNVDSGKSTLTGVLSRGQLDDGRGSARAHVFVHAHELESGRTSNVSTELMGFKGTSQVLPASLRKNKENERGGGNSSDSRGKGGAPPTRDQQAHSNDRAKRWVEVMGDSDRTVSLIDLAGHERYLKTTVFGLTAMRPDAALLVVGANMGVQLMTREHIGVASALQIPVVVALTKVDICPPDVLKHTRQTLANCLRAAGSRPFPVLGDEQIAEGLEGLRTNTMTPIFLLSNVTGKGLPQLKEFLRRLQPAVNRLACPKGPAKSAGGNNTGSSASVNTSGKVEEVQLLAQSPSEEEVARQVCFGIDGVYVVPGVGCVTSGVLNSGKVTTGQKLLLGPDKVGEFLPVVVRSIERHRMPTKEVLAGQSATLALRSLVRKVPLKRPLFRKGMVLVSDTKVDSADKNKEMDTGNMRITRWPGGPLSIREFDAEVLVLHHQTTISLGYEAYVHTGVIRQTAKLIEIVHKTRIQKGKTKGGAKTAAKTSEGAKKKVLGASMATVQSGAAAAVANNTRTMALRTGDRARVRMRFCFYCEHLLPGSVFIFRDGRAKGLGRVKAVYQSTRATSTRSDV